jgi:hypothetical protein
MEYLSVLWRRVPSHKSSKSRQGAWRAFTRCYVRCSFGPHILRPRTSHPCWGEFRHCHVSLSSGPRFSVEVGSSASMCLVAPGSASPRGELWCYHVSHDPSGLWTTEIKKCLASLGMQLDSRVSKARSCIIESSARCAGYYSAALQCSTDPADHS